MSDQNTPAEQTPQKTGGVEPEHALVLAALAVLPAIFASGFTAYEHLKSGLMLIFGAAVLVSLAVRVFRGQKLELRGWLSALPLAVLSIWALVSALWAPNALGAVADASGWMVLLGFFVAALAPWGRGLKLSHVSLAVGVGTLVVSVIGLLQSFGVVIDSMAPGSIADGLRATFDHERYGAIALACAAPLLAAGMWLNRGPARVLVGISLAASGLYVGATGTAVAWGLLGAGLVVPALVLAVTRGGSALQTAARPLGALAAMGVLVGVGAAALDPPPPTEKMIINGKVVERAPSGYGTLDAKYKSIYAIQEADWGRPDPPADSEAMSYALNNGWSTFQRELAVGVGAGNWNNVQMRDINRGSSVYQSSRSSYPAYKHVHSSLLQSAVELGVFGGLLILLFMILVAAPALRSLRGGEQGDERWVLSMTGLLGAFGALSVAVVLTAALEMAATSVLFVVVCGLLTREALARLSQGGQNAFMTWTVGSGAERYGLWAVPAILMGLTAVGLGVATTASDYYKARGDVWLRAGNIDPAVEAYKQSVAIWPGNDLAFFNLANIFDTGRSRKDTEALLLETIKMRPHDPRLFAALGHLQMREAARRGRDKDIRELFDEKEGEAPKIKENVARDPSQLLQLVDREVMKQAMINLNAAKELHPRYIVVYDYIHNAYMLDKDTGKAQAELLRALEQVSEEEFVVAAKLHNSLANAYLADQSFLKAKKHFEKVLELQPSHPQMRSISQKLVELDMRIKGIKPPNKHNHAHGPGGHKHGPGAGAPPGAPKIPGKGPHKDEHKGEHGHEDHKGEHKEDHKGEHKGEPHEEGHKGEHKDEHKGGQDHKDHAK